MSAVERYLRRATRGLWGQKRRDALMELRGAIEDKIYRHRLLGLDEAEATAAALRDLGSPHAIARDLHRVHTGPPVARLTLLLGVTGLLGLQAVAQVNVVHAVPDPRSTINCRYDEAYLASLLPQAAEATRRQLAQPGGRERLTSRCQEEMTDLIGNQLLKLADVWTAFRGSGIRVEQLPGSTGLYNITFPGSATPRLIDLGQSVQFVGGQKYVNIAMLVEVLAHRTVAPLQLSGTENPTLTVGPAALHLGTVAAPVRAHDVYTAALLGPAELKLDQRVGVLLPGPADLARSYAFRAAAPDGTHYAILDNRSFVCQCTQGTPHYWLLVQVARGGQVLTGVDTYLTGVDPVYRVEGIPVMVNTLAELKAATAAGKRALLVYRLNTTDLRQVLDTPIPATPLSRPEATGGKG